MLYCSCSLSASAKLYLSAQGNAERRPQDLAQIFEHMLFGPPGRLRFLESADENWEDFVQRQAADLHAAIAGKDCVKVEKLLACTAVHLNMQNIDEKSMIRPLHRAAFSGDVEVMQVLLAEIPDHWPLEVRREYLDCKTGQSTNEEVKRAIGHSELYGGTSLGYTPFMIACKCGFMDVAALLQNKGCDTELVNHSGKTGQHFVHSFMREQEWSALRPWDRGDRIHLAAEHLELYLQMLRCAQTSEDLRAGLRLWNSKLLVHYLSKAQMGTLEASIESLLQKNLSLAVSTKTPTEHCTAKKKLACCKGRKTPAVCNA